MRGFTCKHKADAHHRVDVAARRKRVRDGDEFEGTRRVDEYEVVFEAASSGKRSARAVLQSRGHLMVVMACGDANPQAFRVGRQWNRGMHKEPIVGDSPRAVGR